MTGLSAHKRAGPRLYSGRTGATRRFGAKIALAAAAVGLVAGCTSGGKGSAPLGEAAAGSTSSPSTSLVPRVVNQTVWFAGFKVTVTTVTPVDGSSAVRIGVLLLNEGDSSAPLDPNVDLASGGHHYRVDSTTLPAVPGAAQVEATLAFVVDPGFSLDDAIATFGRPSEVQAVLPLGRAGQLVDLKPRPVSATGKVTVNRLALTVGTAELRADIPVLHRQAPKGQRELRLTAKAALSSGDTTLVDANSLRLRRPDGALVEPDAIPTLMVAPGAPGVDVTASFPVPEAAPGKYQLVLESRPGDNGSSTASVGFTLEPA